MTLRKIIFLKFTILLTIMIFFVAGNFVYFSIEHHLEDEIESYKARATTLAGALSRLMMWNDRVAVQRLLKKEIEVHKKVEYIFIKKGKEPYEHTFDRGIPKGLLQIGFLTSSEPAMWKFKSTKGNVYYNVFVNIDSSDSELHIGLNKDSIITKLYPHFYLIIAVSLLMIMIGVALAYFFAHRITSEINILFNSISSYISSGKEFDVDPRETEAKEIVSAFNKMIEKQKKTEISLKQSQETLSQIASDWENTFDAIESPIALINSKEEIRRCNRAQKDLLGIEYKKIIGRKMHDLLHSENSPSVCLISQVKNSRKRESGIFKRNNLWFQCIVDPILDVSGEFIGAVYLLHDITDRFKAEEQNRRLSTAVEQSANIVVITDPDGNIEYVNPKFSELTGYEPKEVIGKNPRILNSEFHSKKYYKELWETISSGKIWEGEFYNKKKNGDFYWEKATITPVKDDDGKITDYIAIKEDVSDYKYEKNVQAAQLRLLEYSIDNNVKEYLQKFLDEIEIITGSNRGFCHFVEEDQKTLSLQTWSTNTLNNMCSGEVASTHYPISEVGVWVDCVREKRPVIHNDYANLSHKKGLPEGHAPVIRELVVPVIRGTKIMAIVGVGNKNNLYNQDDVVTIRRLADIAWETVDRIKTEFSLRDREQRYRALFDRTNDAVFLFGLDDIHMEANQKAADMLGCSVDEIVGQHAGTFTKPEENPDSEKKKELLLEGKILPVYERTFVKKDGTEFSAEISIALVEDNEGNATHYQSIVRDISKRKKAEDALKESEEKYRTLSSNLPGIVYRDHLSGDKNFEIINELLEELTGYKLEELKSGAIYSIVPLIIDEDREFVINEVEKSVKQKRIFEIEYRIKHKDGSIRNFLERGNPVFDSEGKPLYIDGIILDNTIQKGAIEEIEKQKDFFMVAINALTHPFYIVDVNTHKVILKNNASEKFIESENLHCYSITHGRSSPCDDRSHLCPIEEIKKTKKPVILEHIHTDDSGREVIHKVHGFPILDENGDLIQIIKYYIDITEKKQSEAQALKQQEEFIRADKMINLGILVSGVAHEINNPNNSILLNSQFLAKAWQDLVPILDRTVEDDPALRIGGVKYGKFKEKTPELFAGISESSARIREIVEDLKRFSRKDLPDKRSQVDVNAVIKSAVNLLSGYINKSTNNFILKPGKNLPLIWANSQKIEQVIINLIQNSCHAVTSNFDTILITTKFDQKGDYIVVTVKDEGTGIKKSDLKYITEPFFTTKRESGGTGLGLSVSEKIINDHKGKLLFTSKPGEGTIAEVFIPSFKNGSDIRGEKSE